MTSPREIQHSIKVISKISDEQFKENQRLEKGNTGHICPSCLKSKAICKYCCKSICKICELKFNLLSTVKFFYVVVLNIKFFI